MENGMIKELYGKICERTDTRACLIALKKEIREEGGKRALAYLLAGDYSEFALLLKDEDAKVRKNAAFILGEMECEDMLPRLWDAYQTEEQLFVRPAYLRAMSAYDCRVYVPELKKRRDYLLNAPVTEAAVKHVREEAAALRALLLKYEKEKNHVFTGLARETDIYLMTNREHREITAGQLKEEKPALFPGGVRIRTRDLQKLDRIRTWSEILFPIRGAASIPAEPQEAAKALVKSELMDFLKSCHEGSMPFYFRLEVRGRMEQVQKNAFIKRFTAALELATGRELVNSASSYEIELRLLQKKSGDFVPLLKLYTRKDRRFSYRRNVLAASIQPVSAALIMELLRPYLKEHAQVLDPFCGVGTMLIERVYLMAADPVYGIDLYGEAIAKARENAETAKIQINFINRDFLDFHHEYRFDEIITNMPAVTGTKSMEEITRLYEKFFLKAREVLNKDGILALYTTEESILLHCLKLYDFLKVEKKWVIREKEGSVLYVLKMI